MKISQQPTNHILVKAHTDSEWASCNFAVITCEKGWRELLEKRLNAVRLFDDQVTIASFKFFDGAADFFVSLDGKAEELLSEAGDGKKWTFIELDEGEEDVFDKPESLLDCYMLTLYKDGTGRYCAHGKYTNENFYTATIPLGEIVGCMQ